MYTQAQVASPPRTLNSSCIKMKNKPQHCHNRALVWQKCEGSGHTACLSDSNPTRRYWYWRRTIKRLSFTRSGTHWPWGRQSPLERRGFGLGGSRTTNLQDWRIMEKEGPSSKHICIIFPLYTRVLKWELRASVHLRVQGTAGLWPEDSTRLHSRTHRWTPPTARCRGSVGPHDPHWEYVCVLTADTVSFED